MSWALLIDVTRCVGCEACVLACRQVNGLPADQDIRELTATSWLALAPRAGRHVRRQCMHCVDPACVSVCPVGALRKTPEGPVLYDETRCIGCRYCMVACPFSVPRFEWDRRIPRIRKCFLCFHQRLAHGQAPACASVCPTGATTFGSRRDMLDVARRRIHESPDRYVDHIYGETEAGGTCVLYLSDVPFTQLGLPGDLAHQPYPRLTWSALSRLPRAATGAGALLLGTWWLIDRRMRAQRGELDTDDGPGEGEGGTRT